MAYVLELRKTPYESGDYELKCRECTWTGMASEWEEHFCGRCNLDVCWDGHVCLDREQEE